VVRENSVTTDFVGFLSPSAPSFRHEDFAYDHSHSVSQSGYLRMVQSGGMGADSRVTTAARSIQAQVEEAPTEKQGPTILVIDLKALARLEIGADYRKARERDPMGGEKVSRVLA
jgi:hypothetical protein